MRVKDMTGKFAYGIIFPTQKYKLKGNTMSLKLVEIVVLGQVLRLNVPQDQEDALRQAARHLDALVSEMKEKTGLIQLDRVLSIVALNLSFELTQEKNKNAQIEDVLKTRIRQLDHSLENIRLAKEQN